MTRPVAAGLTLFLLLALPATPAGAQWLGLQYRATLGEAERSGRLYLYVDRDQLPKEVFAEREDTAPHSPASATTVGLPLLRHGPYVPGLVYDAAVAQSAGAGEEDLARVCRSHPLSCTLSGYAFADSAFLDLGLYRPAGQMPPVRSPLRSPVRIAP